MVTWEKYPKCRKLPPFFTKPHTKRATGGPRPEPVAPKCVLQAKMVFGFGNMGLGRDAHKAQKALDARRRRRGHHVEQAF
jgi:hypothetical protein